MPDGRLGILFDPEDGPLRNEVTQALFGARSKARAQKDWAKADKIRDLLREQNVEPPDDHSVVPGMGMAPQGYAALQQPAMAAAAPAGFSDTEMYVLLHHREKCRMNMDMAGATALTNILHQHGVVANDATGMFQTSTGVTGALEMFRYSWQPQAYAQPQAAYAQPQYAAQPAAYAQPQYAAAATDPYAAQGAVAVGGNSEVQALVDKWQHTRARREWQEADAIRSTIRALGVRLLDDERIWVATDGSRGPYPQT